MFTKVELVEPEPEMVAPVGVSVSVQSNGRYRFDRTSRRYFSARARRVRRR